MDIPSDLPPVRVDRALTEQILVNLIGNAAVHTPAGTTVELRVHTGPEYLVVEVADNGPGLPSGDWAQVFDPFQRGSNAAPGGTGVGLSLVRGFVEAQGGFVTAQNRADSGALFTVRVICFISDGACGFSGHPGLRPTRKAPWQVEAQV